MKNIMMIVVMLFVITGSSANASTLNINAQTILSYAERIGDHRADRITVSQEEQNMIRWCAINRNKSTQRLADEAGAANHSFDAREAVYASWYNLCTF